MASHVAPATSVSRKPTANALPDGAIPNADLLGFSHMLDAYHQFANAARAKAEASSVLVSAGTPQPISEPQNTPTQRRLPVPVVPQEC